MIEKTFKAGPSGSTVKVLRRGPHGDILSSLVTEVIVVAEGTADAVVKQARRKQSRTNWLRSLAGVALGSAISSTIVLALGTSNGETLLIALVFVIGFAGIALTALPEVPHGIEGVRLVGFAGDTGAKHAEAVFSSADPAEIQAVKEAAALPEDKALRGLVLERVVASIAERAEQIQADRAKTDMQAAEETALHIQRGACREHDQ